MNLSTLEQLARGATPGPWHVDEDSRPGMSWNRHIMSAPNMGVCFMAHSDGAAPARDKATAKFIAAANPETILRLLAVVKAAKELDDEMRPIKFNNGGLFAALRSALDELAPFPSDHG